MPLNVGGGDALFFKTGIDPSGVKSGALAVKGILAGLTKNISTMDVFAGLSIGGAIAFGKISAEMYKFSRDYKKAMIEVSTISDDVAKDIEGVSDKILELTRILPQTAEQLAKAEYQIISAGITDVAESLDVLRVSAELATAGLTDTFTTADALTSIMNAYGKQAGTAEQISDKLFTTVRLGKINMQQLATNIGMVTGLASQVGLEFADLTTAISVGTKTVRPEIFFTAIRGFLTSLVRPSEDAAKMAEKLGIEWSTAGLRAKGLTGFLKDLNEKTGGSDKILGKLLPNVRGLIGLLALGADEGRDFADAYGEMIDSVGSKNDALALQLEETGNKTKIFWNNIKAELADFGDATLDIIDSMVSGLNKAFEKATLREELNEALTNKGLATALPVGSKVKRAKTAIEGAGLGIEDLEKRLRSIYVLGEKSLVGAQLKHKLINDIIARQLEIEEQIQAVKDRVTDRNKTEADNEKKASDKRRADAEARLEEIEKAKEQMKQFEKETEDANKLTDKREKERKKKDLNDLIALNKKLAREELQIHNKKYRNLLKSYHRFTDERLKEYLARLKEELKSEEWLADEKEILLERIGEVEDDMAQRTIRHIREIGDAFDHLANIVTGLDENLAKTLNTMGGMARGISSLATAITSGNILGQVSSGVGLLSTIMGASSKSKYERNEDVSTGFGWNMVQSMLDAMNSDESQKAMRDPNKTIEPLTRSLQLMKDTIPVLQELVAEYAKLGDGTFTLLTPENLHAQNIAIKEITDQLHLQLTGTTADSIADGIADGFASGLSSAEVFAQSFEQIMQNALMQSFNRQIMEGFLDEWYISLSDALESNGLDEGEIDILSNALRQGIVGSKKIFDALGLGQLFGDEDDEGFGSPQGLTGAIAGITEQTAGLLEGNINAMRIDMREVRNSVALMDDMLEETTRIADNTEFLKSIDRKLSTNTEILRSMGVA